ncbi:MAG: hypothetical protein KDA75_01180 [Planctomycetaceae bacterium]|nr:hypothetical protein [Planctomycetaceae bacterium]
MRDLLTLVMLAGLTGIAFYQPMQMAFWRGADDTWILGVRDEGWLWHDRSEMSAGRPLQMAVSPNLAQLIAPDRIEGFWWVTSTIWCVNALLVLLIVRRMLPGQTLLAASAAILMIVSPTEPSRFYVCSMTLTYCTSLCALLLALWTMLIGLERKRVGWMLLSGVLLGGTLLSNEGQFPLALIGFPLIWFSRSDRTTKWLAACVWLGVIGLLSLRLVQFLLSAGEDSYQLKQAGRNVKSVNDLLAHLWMQVHQLQEYLPASVQWGTASAAVLLGTAGCIAVILWLGRRPNHVTGFRQLLVGATLAAGTILLGIAPFLHMTDVFRTQYFAMPGQAVLVAVLITGVTGWLPRVAARPAHLLLLATVSLAAVDAGYRRQAAAALDCSSFQRTAHVFEQIHGIAPRLGAKQAALLFADDGRACPVGVNSCVCRAASIALGTAVFTFGSHDPSGNIVEFRPDEVRLGGPPFHIQGPLAAHQDRDDGSFRYGYDDILAFRMTADGNLLLLDELPTEFLPPDAQSDQYNPAALLAADRPDPVTFFRYQACDRIPADVIPPGEGLLLDADWGPLCLEDGRLGRTGGPDAELLVNPLGQDRRTVTLQIGSADMSASGTAQVDVVSEQGAVVSQFALSRGGEIKSLPLPLDPSRINRFSFRVRSDTANAPASVRPGVRLLTDANLADAFQLARLSRSSSLAEEDIFERPLKLGRHWSPLVRHKDTAFRWVDNAAEVLIPASGAPSGILELDVERGPSVRPGPLTLELRTMANELVGVASVPVRKRVQFPLVWSTDKTERLKLCVREERQPVPNDPRMLSFRVFEARLLASSESAVADGKTPRGGSDISGGSVSFGAHWEPTMTKGDVSFRWADTAAEFTPVVIASEVPIELELDVAPGPSCGELPARVSIRGNDGNLLGEAQVSARKTIRLTMPADSAARRPWTLQLDSQRSPLPNDKRFLCFKVFSIRCRSGTVTEIAEREESSATASQ